MGRPKKAVKEAPKLPTEMTDAEAESVAREMYCTMPVARLRLVGIRVRRPVEQIIAWRDANNWMHLRVERQKDNIEKILEKVKDPVRCDIERLKAIDLMNKLIVQQLKERGVNNITSGEMQQYSAVMQAMQKLEEISHKSLRLRK